jgi:D-glycero-D-manno-heptose 1,7-bisphosphate phosphatase
MKIDKGWTLFLDRDGVINKELPGDYVKTWDEFHFEPGALEAIVMMNDLFSSIYIVTNQRGVGINVMSEDDLHSIHKKMMIEVERAGGRIDKIYYCADADRNSPMRKPRPGMALKAKEENPSIDFSKSIMAGNSKSDMEFGRAAGMITVFIDDKGGRNGHKDETMDFIFYSLKEFADYMVGATL